MAGRFKYDNKVFEVINAIVDLLVLGFFWIITSIPVFTMGASTTALYYTVNKSIRNKKDMHTESTGRHLSVILNRQHYVF